MKRFIFIYLAILIPIAWISTAANGASFDWPQWRGPDRTDVSKETGLLKEWPSGGPKQIWLYKSAGNGYSAPAIAAGKLFTMGTRGETECVIALDANTGKELWTAPIGPIFNETRGNGPRGTPTVDGDRVYALGGQGILIGAQVTDGKVLWQQSMRELGGKRPNWGFTESVLVDGNQVVCTPGGPKGALAALDKITGKLIWQSEEFTDDAQYVSMILAEHDGTKQYIQLTMRSLVGIAPKDGKLLWKSPWTGKVAVIPTPIFHDGFVYITSGYQVGCKMVKLGKANEVSEVYANNLMQNHHGGVLLVDDHIYGHSDRAGWLCQKFKTGEEVWSEKKALGKGAVTCADGMLYCLEENSGTIALIDASPKGWKEHGRFKLEPQTSIRSPQGKFWTHPVVSNGKLYLRDQDLIFCYDVKKG